MASSPKVIALKTRASQVSHLCFPVHGIVENLGQIRLPIRITPNSPGFRSITLGDAVTQFDFTTFYAGLSEPSKGNVSRLLYNSSAILNDPKVRASLLVTLRAEPVAAALDKAINTRQNAYYAKYANQSQIISVMQNFYTATNPPLTLFSKPDALVTLRGVAESQMDDLMTAYANPPSSDDPNGGSFTTSQAAPSVVVATSSTLTTNGSFPDTTQNINNTEPTYRTPVYEAQGRGWRAKISLMDQQFSQFMASQNLPHLYDVFNNELQSIDLDVKRLQVAYLNTILMSPINGVITGIYKNPGDWVRAGEPVIRVEDNSSVIIVGTIAYNGPISIDSTMTITTSLFDQSNTPPILGRVIAVRGYPNEDDVWEVHAICDNFATPQLPHNYSFDYDNTSVTIN
jgi:hypothetical protein